MTLIRKTDKEAYFVYRDKAYKLVLHNDALSATVFFICKEENKIVKSTYIYPLKHVLKVSKAKDFDELCEIYDEELDARIEIAALKDDNISHTENVTKPYVTKESKCKEKKLVMNEK